MGAQTSPDLGEDAIVHLKRGLDLADCECGNMDLRSWYGEPSREKTIRALLDEYDRLTRENTTLQQLVERFRRAALKLGYTDTLFRPVLDAYDAWKDGQ